MVQWIQRRRRAAALTLSSVALLAVVALMIIGVPSARAQQAPSDLLRTLQQRGGVGTETTAPTGEPPAIQTYQPVGEQAAPPQSQLEQLYSARAGRPLTQFGYGALGSPATITLVQSGAVQDSYVLGIGDELVFELRGQENASYRQTVDRDGRVVLPKLDPIVAAGRTFGEFRNALETAVRGAYVSTKVFVSLGQVRQVSVLVTGFVRTPGMRVVGGLASPLDAILLSGGISKTGSLRGVQLIRRGMVRTIDLYHLLLSGPASDLGTVQDGDRIFVPHLGNTVAITGSVTRSGIFELPAGSSGTTASALLNLAGGAVIANAYNLSKLELESNGTMRLVPISKGAGIRNGEVLYVDPSRSESLDQVTLEGAVQLPGTRPLSLTRTIGSLFHSVNELLPTAYAPFAVIVRRSQSSNATSLIPFSVISALNHSNTIALQSGDTIHIFTATELNALTRLITRDINTPYGAPSASDSKPATAAAFAPPPRSADPAASSSVSALLGGLSQGSSTDSALMDPRLRAAAQNDTSATAALADAQSLVHSQTGSTPAAEVGAPTETDDQVLARISTAMGVPSDMLIHTVSDHLVWVLDQVRVPGVYAAASGTSLTQLIEAAGGASRQADMSAIEVTSTDFDPANGTARTTRNLYAYVDPAFQSALAKPLDIVRLRRVFTDRTGETITVAGQVRFPGVFDIVRDERLSSVLQRAGGLTEVAYPYGAIFTRRSAALAEQEGHQREAKELERQISVLVTTPDASSSAPNPGLPFLSSLADEVRNAPALGRVSVTADPVVLASRPDLDFVMEPGDSLFIPKRPSTVNVSGEVLNPGGFQFQSKYSYGDYLRMAGGMAQTADGDRTFIVLPDGSAVPVSDSWLTFSDGGHIPPGSTIVVPRDLRPFDWGSFLKDATQIVAQLAVSAASLSVISRSGS